MEFNDRRKGTPKLGGLLNRANNVTHPSSDYNRPKKPFDLRNSPKTLRKNISNVSMEGSYGIKHENPVRKNGWE